MLCVHFLKENRGFSPAPKKRLWGSRVDEKPFSHEDDICNRKLYVDIRSFRLSGSIFTRVLVLDVSIKRLLEDYTPLLSHHTKTCTHRRYFTEELAYNHKLARRKIYYF